MRSIPHLGVLAMLGLGLACTAPDSSSPTAAADEETTARPDIGPVALDEADDDLADGAALRHDEAGTRALVFQWNDLATRAVGNAGAGPDALPPFVEAVVYALANTAMHDALNAIHPRYARYAHTGAGASDASATAAAAQAAHDVLVAVLPPFPELEVALAANLAAVPDVAARNAGVAVGKAAAGAILATRIDDGSAAAQVPYTFGTQPGDYRATPPFDGPPFNGFAAVPAWGKVRPFVMRSGSQFRVPPPYGRRSNADAVKTARYAREYREVVRLGGTVSDRTADQSEIALFWLENSPLGWNRMARTLAERHGLGAWRAARLFALVGLAEADAYIATFDSKYHYNFWRPFTATQLDDGNPATDAAPSWSVFAFPTPPIPDYPSGHGTAGGAAAAVLWFVFRGDTGPFEATSSSLPGVTRHFRSPWDAAWENADSRIYAGYHFRLATEAGTVQGAAVGFWAATHALRRLH